MADPELHEISLVLSIKNNTQELSFSTDDGGNLPFLGGLSSGRSEERRPGRISELQIETGRHGDIRLTSVKRLVHLDLCDRSSDLCGCAVTNRLLVIALSTVTDLIRTVVVRSFEVTPDGTIGDILLVA